MPTAAEALAGAAPAGGSPGGTPGGTGATAGAAGGAPASGAPVGGGPAPQGGSGAPAEFWNSWDKPEHKEVRDFVAGKKFPDPLALATAYRDADRQLGTLRSARPGYPVLEMGADGKPTPAYTQAMKAWGMTVGVPEKPGEYEIEPIKGEPSGGKLLDFMREEMVALGVPKAMAPGLVAGYERAMTRTFEAMRAQEKAQSELAMAEYERESGPQYKENLAFAARGKEIFASRVPGLTAEKLVDLELNLGTIPMMKFFGEIGRLGGEMRSLPGQGNTNSGLGFQGGPSEAQQRFNQYQADRASGKISNHEWNELAKPNGEIDKLIAAIAAGNAPQH
jgi:hypothetical protein